MRQFIPFLAAAWVATGFGSWSTAQTLGADGPPKILQTYVEEVKPGHGPAHEKLESAWSQAFAEGKWPVHFMALTSITGVNVAWFMSGYDSFAAIEKADQAMEKVPTLKAANDQFSQKDGEHLSGGRGIIARLQKDMSHTSPVNLAKTRYFRVVRRAVRVGKGLAFREANKMLLAG